jgi:hypothetical protein
MALVHHNSCECTKSELDLFEVPPTQTNVVCGYWEKKGLTSALTDVPFLSGNDIRCVPLLGLPTSGLFSLGRFHSSLSWWSYRVHSFLNKFCPVDFNRDFAACTKPTHRCDTKAYHDYCIHQTGKGYPVFVGIRYQRGHGLGSRI